GRDPGDDPGGGGVPPATPANRGGEPGMSTALSTRLAGNLILARLLTAGKRPPSPSVLRADVGKLFPAPPSGEQFQEYIRELVDAGLVTTRPFRLTDEGRAQALEFLGVDALPPRANW